MSSDARPLPVVSQRTSPQISTARLDFAPAPSDPHVELMPSALLYASWCIGQEDAAPSSGHPLGRAGSPCRPVAEHEHQGPPDGQWFLASLAAFSPSLGHLSIDFDIGLFGESSISMSFLQAALIATIGVLFG